MEAPSEKWTTVRLTIFGFSGGTAAPVVGVAPYQAAVPAAESGSYAGRPAAWPQLEREAAAESLGVSFQRGEAYIARVILDSTDRRLLRIRTSSKLLLGQAGLRAGLPQSTPILKSA